MAIAVLGPSGRVAFGIYDAPHSFDPVRRGADELAFLTGGEIAAQDLGTVLLPGPTIAISTVAVMVPDGLAGAPPRRAVGADRVRDGR